MSRELRGVVTSVSIFIQQEYSTGSSRNHDHVAKTANFRRVELTRPIDREVLDTLSGSEFLQIADELLHPLSGAAENVGQRALNFRVYIRYSIVDVRRLPRGLLRGHDRRRRGSRFFR